ncbi:MAG: asparagine synthase (glutamine-hydrolyzing) [Azospirillaceae bacterium]
MCGIIAVVGDPRLAPGGAGPTRDVLRSARDVMASRGPDGVGEVEFEERSGRSVWLGHRRLSILDLSDAGAQPMWSDCGRFVITYNGEVYNTPDLRRALSDRGRRFRSTTDTEVIVNGYAEWGPEVVDRLVGMFAFVIWDDREQQLFAARDRLGIKPLSYVVRPGGIALASDARALHALGAVGSLDDDAIGAYLTLGYAPAPLSIWRDAAKLPAGSVLSWRPDHPGSVAVRSYWTPPDATDSTPRRLDDWEALIDEVVADHMLSDVPVGLFLSGGLDSSVVASSVAKTRPPTPLAAVTVGIADGDGNDESPAAARTAEHLCLDWRSVMLDPGNAGAYFDRAFAELDEPLGYSAIVTQAVVSAMMAGRNKVVLSGDGGDEVFGGYTWYDDLDALHAIDRPRSGTGAALRRLFSARRAPETPAQRFARTSVVHAHLRRILPVLIPGEIAEIVASADAKRIEEVVVESLRRHDAPGLPMKRRLQRIDLMTFCQDVVLPKVDRTAMARSIEVRPPLLDHRLVEWGIASPVSAAHDGEPKAILRRILERRSLGFLCDAPKRGFGLRKATPYSEADMRERITAAARDGDAPWALDWDRVVGPKAEKRLSKVGYLFYFTLWKSGLDPLALPGAGDRSVAPETMDTVG